MRAALALVALVCAVSCAANPPINIAFHWHMHQPIYYPYESVVTTIDNNRFSYSLLDIFNSRSGPYTSWPIDAIQTAVSGGLNHCGAQVSFSGALQENLLNLQNSSLTGSFSTWQQRWQFAASNLFTSLKNPAVYLTAFGYHHPMMPLTDPFFVTLQILLHRHAIQSVLLPHQAPNADLMTGLFPPENAFSERIIPALLKAGIKWVLVDNIHFDRAHTNYPWTSGENLYPPNPADQTNNQSTNWVQLDDLWAPSKVSAPFGYRPYWVQYTDPATGEVSKIIAVPGARYEGVEDGRGGFGAFLYGQVMSQYAFANTDPNRPMIVVLAHDGDNYGGGSDGYYHGNFNSFVSWAQGEQSKGTFECTTISDYLQQFPVPDSEVIHVEDGSWSGANNGDPQFLKWNPNFFTTQYEPERTSWAVLVAATNRILTAQTISPYSSLDNIWTGSSKGSYTEQALHYFLCSQASDYEYWPTEEIWNSDPARAANLAVAYADKVISVGKDTVPPTIFVPQRQYWNPGSVNWNPSKPDPADFQIATAVYDVSGVASVNLMLRVCPGQNATTPDNQLYNSTPAGCQAWQSFPMNKVPLTGPLAPQTDPLPIYIADLYFYNVTGIRNSLVDYYVASSDTLSNSANSDILHVFVAGSH